MNTKQQSAVTGLLIGVLAGTAILMAWANLAGTPARAEAARDRDYQIVTAKTAGGNDAIYVVNNTTGQVAIFEYDATARALRLRDVRPMTDVIPPLPGR
jgi:hypothetical protein